MIIYISTELRYTGNYLDPGIPSQIFLSPDTWSHKFSLLPRLPCTKGVFSTWYITNIRFLNSFAFISFDYKPPTGRKMQKKDQNVLIMLCWWMKLMEPPSCCYYNVHAIMYEYVS